MELKFSNESFKFINPHIKSFDVELGVQKYSLDNQVYEHKYMIINRRVNESIFAFKSMKRGKTYRLSVSKK